MAIGNRGSIVIDVQAQITGYSESIDRMKKALDEIDPGSSIGKKLSKGIAAAEKELASLGKEGMKRISSQVELDRLNDKLLKVGNLITNLGAGFQQVSWKDLTSGAAQELRDLEKQVNNVRQATQNIVGDGFSKLITDAPELKKVFDELKIDPNRMGLNTIEEKFTQTMNGLNKQIKDFEQKVEKSQNKINEYTTLQNNAKNLSPDALGYLVGDRSKALKSFQATSGQKDVIGKTASSIPALSKAYVDEVKNLGDTILNNLGLGKARENNLELVEKLRPQIEEKIQQLLEARSTEAIQQILNDINKTLITGTSTGTPRGAGLATVAGTPERKNAVNFLTEKLSGLAASSSSKVDLDAFNFTKSFMGNYLEQLRAANYDTSDIDQVFNNLLPQMKEEEIKARFEQIAQAIVDGIRETATKAKEASEKLPKEQESYNGLNEVLGDLKAKREQVSQAQQKVDPLINELRNTISNQETRIKSLEEQIRQLTEANSGKESPFKALGAETIENTAAQIEAATLAASQYQHKLEQIQSLQQGLNNLQSFAQRWFSVYGAMRLVSNTFKSIKTNIKELDDIMTEIAIVTDMSQADLWQQMPQYISLAKEYASSLKGVYEVSQLYYQQGLQQADVMAMTEETLKMARISGLSYSQATDYMTNAVRSFRMEMSESQRVVDVYSALAASSATSTTELATAMSKTASSAQAVGSSFENTTAMMAVMIEATREAPENIGTAMKSIISRYGEMTTNPTKLVDAEGEEMSLNKVDKALQTVGISIHDAQGQFRDFDDVIMELAASWDTIDKNTQRYIATVMAGNRQQSRFLALVSNYERLVELSDEAANSEDAATLQVMKTMDSVSAKAQQLQTSLQSMYTQTGLEEFYKGVLDFTNGIIATFTQMPTMFKLPIPAILAFGQMFINVGTSLASVIKMLRDKLSTASAATEKEMTIAQQIAGKERITAEEKVWLERVQAAKKGAEQIKTEERGIADAANQAANQRIGAEQPTVAVTPTIDFSKFSTNLFGQQTARDWYNLLQNPEGKTSFGLKAAQSYFLDPEHQKILNNQGWTFDIANGFRQIQEEVGKTTPQINNLWASLQQNKAATIGLRMVGSSISLIAASMGEATDGARALKGGLQLLGGAMQAVSYAAMKNPYMAVFTGVMTAVQVLSTWIETDAERLERLNKKADDTNNTYLQKRQDYKNFDTEVKKLKELEKARYDSEEANKEYIESSNKLAEQHPELITAFDSEGNAVLDLASTYSTLEEARKAAIESGKEANLVSIERQQEILQQVQERKDNINIDAYSAFREVGDIDEYSFQKAFRDRVKYYLRDQLGAIGGEGDTFKYDTQEQLEKVNNLINDWYNGTLITANDWLKTGIDISKEDAQDLLDNFNQRHGLSSFDTTTVQAVKTLFGGTEDYLDEIIEAVITDKVDEAKELIKNNKDNLQETSKTFNSKLFNAFLTDLQDYSGIILDADSDVEKAKQALKISERAGIAREAELMMYGDQADFEKNTKYFKEFDEINGLISGYMYQQYQQYKDNLQKQLDNGENDITQDDVDNAYINWVKDFSKDTYDNINGWITDLWNKLSITNKQAFNEILKNNGKYTQDEFRTRLTSFGANEELITALIDQYYNNNDYLNFISAIVERQKEQKGYQLTTKNYAEAIRSLGGEELQTVLGVYDTIAAQIDNKQITPQMGQDILDNYLKIWDVTNDLDEKTKDIAQGLINEADFSSLAGFNEFQQAVKDSLLGKQAQNDLINAAHDLVMNRPLNLETEFQTFSQKISSNMEDFEKAISNASKGMDMKDALELAGKMDTTLDSFDLNNGKFFYTNLNDIKDAYFKGTSQYLEDLNVKYNEEIKKLQQKINNSRNNTEIGELEQQIVELETNQQIINDKFEEYTNYQLNSVLIQTGQIRLFLENVLGQGSPDIDAQLSHINKGEYDQLAPEIQQYTTELYNYVNKIQKDIFDKAISSISDEGPQMIDATYATDAQKEILNILGKEVSPGQYLIDLSLKDIQEVQSQIRIAIRNGIITQKQGNDYMAELHKIEFGDNLSNSVQDVLKSYNDIGYDALQSLANALNTSVDMLIGGEQFKDIAPFEIKDNGNFKANLERLDTFLSARYYELSNESYNSIRALFEKASFNENQNKNIIFNKIVANRNKITEEDIGNLATALNTRYEAIREMLLANDDGTYQLNLATIKDLINTYQIEITNELEQLIANEIDTIITSLNGLGDIQSKGTTKIADMQKQVAEINKLSGKNYTMQDLFTYSDTLHGFVYNTNGLIESARQMKEQLETLSGDERWAAEQMLKNTRNTFLQNIDITGFLNAERITPQIEKNLLNSIDAFNKYTGAIGDSSHIMKYSLIRMLKKGGAQAVAAAQGIAAEQGKELSASDVEAAYRREVSGLVDAIDTVTFGAGALVDKITTNLINAAGGKATKLAGTGQYVVESAANLYDAYNELLNRLKATGEATLADINKVAALALENKDGEQQAIDALGDAVGMTYTRFGEILAQAGYELSEELMNQLTSAGIVKQLGGSKMQIANFSAFADLMDWDAGSEEYVSAFKSYNDSLIEMNRKAEKNILEEAKSLESAKAGDQFNLTQLSTELNEAYKLSDKLQQYGAELQDGILTIGEGANLPAIIQEISNAAQQYGGLLSSEMAELADTLANVLKGYADLISGGIKGTLTNVQAESLQEWANQQGVGELDFTPTADGLKLATNSAIELYNVLSQIDSMQGNLVFDQLVESLSSDTGGQYEHVSDTMAEMAKLQKELSQNEKEIALARHYGVDDSNERIQNLEAQNSKLREQLGLLNKIATMQSADPDQFNFMDRKLPDSLQGPLNYWDSVGKAYKAINTAGKTGYMEVQDYVNIINEMANLVQMSSNNLEWMGMNASNAEQRAAELIEAGMGALKNVDGEGAKIALGDIGLDMQVGAENMKSGIEDGVHEMARGQIAMLDAAIQMLEAIVAMEKLGDIDTDGQLGLTIGDIFEIDDKTGQVIPKFTQTYKDWAKDLLSTAKNNEDLKKALNNIKINGQTLKEILQMPEKGLKGINPQDYFNILKSFHDAAKNGDFSLDDIESSVWKTLSELGLTEGTTIDIGDYTIGVSGNQVYEIDWTSESTQEALKKLNEGKAVTKKNQEALKEQLKSAMDKYNAGEQMSEIEVESVLTMKNIIKINEDGETYILDQNGKPVYKGSGKEPNEAFEGLKNAYRLADLAGIDIKDVTIEGKEASGEIEYETGIKIKVRINPETGEAEFTEDGVPGTFNTIDDLRKAAYEQQLKQLVNERKKQDKTYNIEDAKQELTYDMFLYQHYNIIAKTDTKLLTADGEEIKNPTEAVRNEMKEVLQSGKKITDANGNIIDDSLKNNQDGSYTYTLPSGSQIEFVPGPGESVQDAFSRSLKEQLGIDTGLSETLSSAFTDIFSGDTIKNAISSLTEIEPGQLPEVASALGQVATQGEKLQGIPWESIAEGIRAVANAQNGGNGGDGGEGGGNPHDRDTGITGHDKPTQPGNINQPINLDIKADKVDATGSTIDASGASVNMGGTGKTEGNKNESNVGISSITSTGPITVTGGTVTVSGAVNGNSNGNDSQNGGGENQTLTLDVSGVTNAISQVQSAINNLDASNATAAASKFNKAMADTMKSVPSSKKVDITITKPEPIDVTAKVNVSVSVSGGTKEGPDNVTGRGAPGTPAKVIHVSAKSKGNVALAKGRETLMGELGPELVVSGGRYYTVGNNGAEFVDLPDDAIVFNHKQTRRLLGSKHATGGSRGKPVKSENAALSFATGNVSGPALASAAAALNALKAIRAMWQSMLDASAKDLGSRAGAGRGGGGGGGGGGDEKERVSYLHDLEVWYNLERQIAKLEKDITYEETKQNKLMETRVANGHSLYKSYQDELKLLDQQIAKSGELLKLKTNTYNKQQSTLKNSPFSNLLEFNSEGVLQYKGDLSQYIQELTKNNTHFRNGQLTITGTKLQRDAAGNVKKNKKGKAKKEKFNTVVDVAKSTLDFASILNATDKNGKPVYSAEEQLAILEAYGFSKNLLKYDEKGNEIKGDDAAQKMVENFWNQFDALIEETDSLKDAVEEEKNALIELENKQLEILNKLRDNQIDLENKVLDAIAAREQAQIDALQDQRDALEDANNKFLEGLNESLTKEREMYQKNESQTELTKLQRQLAILQRSGGSASQVASLQQQITDKQKDMYFEERQSQIDALQEASDKQIERLDTQIDIMNEALEYQKENGLLWGEVYEIMKGDANSIAGFVSNWSEEYKQTGPTEINQKLTELLQSAQMFSDDRGKANAKQTAWEEYLAAHPDVSIEKNPTKYSSIKSAFDSNFDKNQNVQAATNAAELIRNPPKVTTNNSGGGDGGGGNVNVPTPQYKTYTGVKYSGGKNKTSTWLRKTPGGTQNKKVPKSSPGVIKAGHKISKIDQYSKNTYGGYHYIRLGNDEKWMAVVPKRWGLKTWEDFLKKYPNLQPSTQYKEGGLVDFTGPAWVDGTKKKPEAFLNAQQTQFLKDSLTSSVGTPLPDTLAGLTNILQDLTQAMISNNGEIGGAVIEHAEVNISVPAINNTMDAKQVGAIAFDELMKIARKSGTRAAQRR